MKTATHLARVPIAAIAAVFLASGCASIVKQSYKDTPAGPNVALLPYSGATQVYGSLNPDDDGARLAQNGYVRIGIASFKTDGHVTFEQIQDQATDVGADIVLFSKRKPGGREILQPLAQNNDGTPHALTPYVHVNGSVTLFSGNYGGAFTVGGGTMDFNGKVSSSGIPGVSSSDMAAINAQQYEYTASFWRKIRLSFLHRGFGRVMEKG